VLCENTVLQRNELMYRKDHNGLKTVHFDTCVWRQARHCWTYKIANGRSLPLMAVCLLQKSKYLSRLQIHTCASTIARCRMSMQINKRITGDEMNKHSYKHRAVSSGTLESIMYPAQRQLLQHKPSWKIPVLSRISGI